MLFNKGHAYVNDGLWQKGYDTLQHFVENCPSHPQSHLAFARLHAAMQGLEVTDTMIRLKHREWLKSVLNLPTSNPFYWCKGVQFIAGTYASMNEALAIIKFLIDETDCNSQGLRDLYDESRRSQYDTWRQGDTSIALDTTLPSLDSLDLEILLQRNAVFSSQSTAPGQLKVYPNPFEEALTVELESVQGSLVTIEVVNILGVVVGTQEIMNSSIGASLRQEIALKDLPPGYYRIHAYSGKDLLGVTTALKLSK